MRNWVIILVIIWTTERMRGCSSGYTPMGGECKGCPDTHCDICSISEDHSCSQCLPHYTLSNSTNKCSECPLHSTKCDNRAELTCEIGYFSTPNSHICSECKSKFPHAKECDEEGYYPRVCMPTYYLYEGQCISPVPCGDDNCKECRGDNSGCIQCTQGYGVNVSSGLCALCSHLFLGCRLCSNSRCEQCGEGYTIEMKYGLGSCYPSTGVLEHCVHAYGGETCILCEESYRIESWGGCSRGISNCGEYYEDGECMRCEGNYMGEMGLREFQRDVIEGEKKELVMSSCVEACHGGTIYYPLDAVHSNIYSIPNKQSPANTFCLKEGKCPPGYYLSEDMNCYLCPPSCSQCQLGTSSTIVCFQCIPGYHISGLECLQCKVEGCGECNAHPDHCQECKVGWYMTGDGRCLPCSPGCIQCVDLHNCTICDAAMYPNQQGGCTSCGGVCLQCVEGPYCFQCPNGYYLQQGECKYCGYGDCSSCLGLHCAACFYPNIFLRMAKEEYDPQLPLFGDYCSSSCLYRVHSPIQGVEICRKQDGWCPQGYKENEHYYCIPEAS